MIKISKDPEEGAVELNGFIVTLSPTVDSRYYLYKNDQYLFNQPLRSRQFFNQVHPILILSFLSPRWVPYKS